MNNSNFSFFDMFGDEAAEYKPVEVKKETKKEVKKDVKKNVKTYKLPLKVVSGVLPEFSIKEADIGKDTISDSEIYDFIAARYEQFSKALTQIEVKGMLCKVYTKSYSQALSNQKRLIDDGWRITLNEFSLPLEDGLEIDEAMVKDMWEKAYPCFKGVKTKYFFDPVAKIIVPFIESDNLDAEIKLPCTYFIFGQEDKVINGSDSVANKPSEDTESKDVAESEEDEDAESEELEDAESEDIEDAENEDIEDQKPEAPANAKAKKFTVNDLRKLLSEQNSGLTFAVCRCKDGKYMVYPSTAYVNAAQAATKKEDTYPTKDTQIGLIFTKIKLSPELFGGKEEVDKKAICKFLSKDYEEFADAERVNIIYDKERKLIKPMIAAARKGCKDEVVYSKEEVDEILSRDGYQLVNYSEDAKHLWRIEKTPIGTFKVLWGRSNFIGNTFETNLPKVPEMLWRKMIYLFRRYAQRGLEVCVMLYYSKATGYNLYIPEQEVAPASVKYNPAPLMQYCIEHEDTYIVADFHSHNYMPAFFSSIDDGDEKRAGIFGVFGSYDDKSQTYDFLLRAGTQGMYTELDAADLFENWDRRYNFVRVTPFFFDDEELAAIYVHSAHGAVNFN